MCFGLFSRKKKQGKGSKQPEPARPVSTTTTTTTAARGPAKSQASTTRTRSSCRTDFTGTSSTRVARPTSQASGTVRSTDTTWREASATDADPPLPPQFYRIRNPYVAMGSDRSSLGASGGDEYLVRRVPRKARLPHGWSLTDGARPGPGAKPVPEA